LDLGGTQVTDKGLEHLEHLTSLQTLSLEDAIGVTDLGLVHLRGLTKLRKLNLSGTVVYSRVIDPMRAVLQVESYRYAISQVSQTTLRSILGQAELDELLAERDKINHRLQQVIDQQTDPWGVKVSTVEVKHVDLPDTMKRAMARQAESERERRAKVIHAEGEFQASGRLRDAAETIEGHPMAMQMRFLQTLAEVGAENNTTIVFPVPLDLLSPFLQGASQNAVSRNGKPRPEEPTDVPIRKEVTV
jgi:SPFH domain / Band 7 family